MQNKEDKTTGGAVREVLREFPDDESYVIFTDLQGIRRRGIYRKDQGFQEIAETEIPRKAQFFFPEEDIARWEYEPESQSE